MCAGPQTAETLRKTRPDDMFAAKHAVSRANSPSHSGTHYGTLPAPSLYGHPNCVNVVSEKTKAH